MVCQHVIEGTDAGGIEGKAIFPLHGKVDTFFQYHKMSKKPGVGQKTWTVLVPWLLVGQITVHYSVITVTNIEYSLEMEVSSVMLQVVP